MFETRQISYSIGADDYNRVHGRFDAEDEKGNKVQLFLKDFDSFKLNGVEVTFVDVMKDLLAQAEGFDEALVVETDEDGNKTLVVTVKTWEGEVPDIEGKQAEAQDRAEAEAAKEDIKPEYSVEEPVVADKGNLPAGLVAEINGDLDNVVIFKATISVEFDDLDAAEKSGRKVLTLIDVEAEDVTYYLYDEDGQKWYKNPPAWGPPAGFPLVKGEFSGSLDVYFTVEDEVEEIKFTIKLVDADWQEDVVYGKASFTVDVPEIDEEG